MESILTSIKLLLNVPEECIDFDKQIIKHINSVFFILTQMGVGPKEGFRIKDANAIWDNFIPDAERQELVQSYMHLKVQLLFDPPDRSVIMESYKAQIAEYEWRLYAAAQSTQTN